MPYQLKGIEMTTNKDVRSIAICLCALLLAFTTNRIASAQCCGSRAMGGFSSDVMDYSMVPGQIIEGDSIYLTVNLPELTVLQINGDPTISLGPTRYFVVRGLDPMKTYTFEIVAETLNPAGVALEEKKTLKLRPGANEIVTLKPVKRKVPKPKTPPAKAEEKDASADAEAKAKDAEGKE